MIFDPFSAPLHMESSIFRKHFGIDFNNFWYDFRTLFGIFTCGVVDFSDAFWRRFRYFFTRFSIPFRFDTFLIRFSTPFLHLYIWSRRFFGCILRRFRHTFLTWVWTPFQHFYIWSRRFFGSILASISTLFDTIFKMSARRSSLIAQMQLPLNTKSANPFPRCRCQTRKLANSIRVKLKTGNRVAYWSSNSIIYLYKLFEAN